MILLCQPQLRVFRCSLLEHRNVRIGVLPELEEVLERLFSFAGSRVSAT
ncbi:MAG: hypothetical protein JOZ45_15900 [Acidobacteriaceae bacterium]|nr:hypothetical protein [Acidobacteriaceae bacterium]